MVLDSLAGSIFTSILEEKQLLKEHIIQLDILFPSMLQTAASIIEAKEIRLLQSESRRYIFKVKGGANGHHYCLTNSSYCTCPAFNMGSLHAKTQIMCKHLLAANLALATSTPEVKKISDAKYVELIQELSRAG